MLVSGLVTVVKAYDILLPRLMTGVFDVEEKENKKLKLEN